MRRALPLAVAFAIAAAACAALWSVPFLSEDHTHLAEAARDRSWLAALDLSREPMRPVQHLFFHALASFERPSPGLARAFGYTLHAATCALVWALARALAGRREDLAERPATVDAIAGLAVLLFALAPTVKGLAWSAAISTPARAFFVLAGLLALVRGRSALLVAASVLALASHENGMVLLPMCALWVALAAAERAPPTSDTLRARSRKAVSALRDAFLASRGRGALLAVGVLVIGYGAYVALLRPERHHGLKALEALPANVVKAATSTFPELVRAPIVGFLRAHQDVLGAVAALALLAAIGALAIAILRRGSTIARFALGAVAIDLVLPTIGTGFNQRYAYLACALVAMALAEWAVTRRKPLPRVVAALAALGWAWDSFVDLREYREAGRIAAATLDAARRARAEAPERTIVLLDVPDAWGSEGDVPLFNWGLPEALAREGIGATGGSWLFWRTRAFRTSTSVELVSEARVAEEVRRRELVVLRPRAGDPTTVEVLVP